MEKAVERVAFRDTLTSEVKVTTSVSDDAIPLESRLVLALTTLCGFGTAEIALRLFITEANVHKRLARAREKLGAIAPDLETPPLADLRSRLPGVSR